MKLSTQNVLLSFITLVTVAFSGTPASASLGGAELMSRSLAAIERHYVEPRRILPRKMLEASLKRIAEVIPEFFFVMQPDAVSITLGHASRRFALSASPSVSDIRRSFREIFPFIDTHYHGPLPHEDIEFTAIDGMVEVLDPHSSFLPPKIYSEFKVGTKGEFGGLGIVIGIRKGTLTVIAALDGTPAARAGIKAEDRIIQIDDLSTINLSLVDAVNKLRGKIGAPVTLQVERSGKTAPLHFALKRALIQIDSVQSTTIDQADKHIGYIKIKSFQENTDRDVAKALASFRTSEKPISGLILDLRNNPGGLLDQSVAISDHFLTSGTVVSTVAARGKVLDEENASADHNEFQLPLIVLVNEGSASASEIVSGALQHHGRAVIVGSRTFGKGSVQTIFELDDQAALKLTIAQYLAGGAKSIQLHGVTPDIELLPVTVDAKEMDIVKDRFIDETLLDEHLERDGRPDENARYHVKFLVPKKEKNPEDDDSAKEYEKNLDFSDDIAVKLAKRLITEAGEPQAEKMLTQAKPIIDSLMKEQDGWLSAALDKIGVDWKITPKSAESPLLRIGFDLKVKGEKRHFLHAGDEATIEFTAKNIGKGAFSQLLGVIQTDAGFLADKELVFGELLPKASKIAVATIKAPEGITSQDIPITVSFQEFHGRAPASLEAIIPVVGDPAPEFAFDLRLKNPSDLTKLRSGKSIELMVDIENTGQGSTSDEAVALLQ
ncbi:MAG: PDZ domain-containing protein, partial [Deltaproteobacteria bacterium]|nr:PDZ domain-containing protein [Deltaproteobacteria bacterium]